jgi:hypothetical protein
VEQHKLDKINRAKSVSSSSFTFGSLVHNLSGEFGRSTKSAAIQPVVEESEDKDLSDSYSPEKVEKNSAKSEALSGDSLPRPSHVSDGRGKMKTLGRVARFISSRVWSSVGTDSFASAPSQDNNDPNPFERDDSKSDDDEEERHRTYAGVTLFASSPHDTLEQSDETTPHDCVDDDGQGIMH